METDKRAIAQQVLQKIHDGTVPGKHCPLCGSAAVDAKTLYAVCERAERRWHDGGDGGGVFVTVIGWNPIVVPLPSNNVVEERRGRDLVVPLPLRVCRDCWRRLYGNVVERVFSLVSQMLFLAGILLIGAWMFSQARGGTVPFSWLAYCFGGAILSHIIADRIARMSWGGRIRDLLDAIPEYRALLEAYPEAEILTREPSALSTADG